MVDVPSNLWMSVLILELVGPFVEQDLGVQLLFPFWVCKDLPCPGQMAGSGSSQHCPAEFVNSEILGKGNSKFRAQAMQFFSPSSAAVTEE